MKWYLDFHSFENNYVKLRTDDGWLNQDNSLKYLDISTDKRIKEMIEKNEVEEIQIFSILDRGKPTGESDAVVFITFNKKEGLTTFHIWDNYTKETDMNENLNTISSFYTILIIYFCSQYTFLLNMPLLVPPYTNLSLP